MFDYYLTFDLGIKIIMLYRNNILYSCVIFIINYIFLWELIRTLQFKEPNWSIMQYASLASTILEFFYSQVGSKVRARSTQCYLNLFVSMLLLTIFDTIFFLFYLTHMRALLHIMLPKNVNFIVNSTIFCFFIYAMLPFYLCLYLFFSIFIFLL